MGKIALLHGLITLWAGDHAALVGSVCSPSPERRRENAGVEMAWTAFPECPVMDLVLVAFIRSPMRANRSVMASTAS
jgi:hypothetical protein